ATDFRFLSSDTPRTDVEVPSVPAKAVPQTAAQTAKSTTTATTKRGSGRPRKSARRGGGVSASRPNRSARRRLNVAKMRAQKEKEKERQKEKEKEGNMISSPQREESGLSAEEKRTIKAESDARKADVERERAQQEEQPDRTTTAPHEAGHENVTASRQEIEAPVGEHGTEARAEDVSQAETSGVPRHELRRPEMLDTLEEIAAVVNKQKRRAAKRRGESAPVVLTEKPPPKTPHPLVEIHVNNSHRSKKADDYPLINNFDIESPQKQDTTTSTVEGPAVQDSGEGQLSGAAAAKTQNAVAGPAVVDVTQEQAEDIGQARGENQGTSVADRIIARLEKSWETTVFKVSTNAVWIEAYGNDAKDDRERAFERFTSDAPLKLTHIIPRHLELPSTMELIEGANIDRPLNAMMLEPGMHDFMREFKIAFEAVDGRPHRYKIDYSEDVDDISYQNFFGRHDGTTLVKSEGIEMVSPRLLEVHHAIMRMLRSAGARN
ncbi:hypothetical protein KEM56_007077, partial [Ascosphaera pollenicola]